MLITIEPNAKPCPGVERAILMAEEILLKGNILYSVGQLIHNRREVERLENLGLKLIKPKELAKVANSGKSSKLYFLVRTHGESEEILQAAREYGFKIVDATCPIVQHSQDIVDQHVREGWGIIIVGSKTHPEVTGLLTRTNDNGIVVSSKEEAIQQDFEERSLLLAQTTIDPVLFAEVRKILSKKLSNLKIVDTTCKFIHNRQNEIKAFSSQQDVVIIVGGENSSNCKLLHKTALKVNKRSFKVEEPEQIDREWLKDAEKIGISGGASTPRWQLEEMKSYLSNHKVVKNPKGLKNSKGGKFSWWMKKN